LGIATFDLKSTAQHSGEEWGAGSRGSVWQRRGNSSEMRSRDEDE
jgi:hypothetical protein